MKGLILGLGLVIYFLLVFKKTYNRGRFPFFLWQASKELSETTQEGYLYRLTVSQNSVHSCVALGLGRAAWWEEQVLEESGCLYRGQEENWEEYLQCTEAYHD